MAGSDLILGHLRAIRSDIGSVKSGLRDIKARMASIESYQVAGHGDAVRQSSRLDEIEARIEQVERRLELRDG